MSRRNVKIDQCLQWNERGWRKLYNEEKEKWQKNGERPWRKGNEEEEKTGESWGGKWKDMRREGGGISTIGKQAWNLQPCASYMACSKINRIHKLFSLYVAMERNCYKYLCSLTAVKLWAARTVTRACWRLIIRILPPDTVLFCWLQYVLYLGPSDWRYQHYLTGESNYYILMYSMRRSVIISSLEFVVCSLWNDDIDRLKLLFGNGTVIGTVVWYYSVLYCSLYSVVLMRNWET